jgi:hypothetical protein
LHHLLWFYIQLSHKISAYLCALALVFGFGQSESEHDAVHIPAGDQPQGAAWQRLLDNG